MFAHSKNNLHLKSRFISKRFFVTSKSQNRVDAALNATSSGLSISVLLNLIFLPKHVL